MRRRTNQNDQNNNGRIYALKSMKKEMMVMKNQVGHVMAERHILAEAPEEMRWLTVMGSECPTTIIRVVLGRFKCLLERREEKWHSLKLAGVLDIKDSTRSTLSTDVSLVLYNTRKAGICTSNGRRGN